MVAGSFGTFFPFRGDGGAPRSLGRLGPRDVDAVLSVPDVCSEVLEHSVAPLQAQEPRHLVQNIIDIWARDLPQDQQVVTVAVDHHLELPVVVVPVSSARQLGLVNLLLLQ
eukprot:1661489-Pyramimonas_sp.AAC.1